MKTKIKFFLVLIFILLVCYGIKYTYSMYISNSQGTGTVQRSRWEIKVNNNDITTGTTQNISFTPTFSNNNVVGGKIAPGASGYFDIQIDSSKVDVSYLLDMEIDNHIGDTSLDEDNPINIIFTDIKYYNKNNVELFDYTEDQTYVENHLVVKMDNDSSSDKLKINYPDLPEFTKVNNTDSNYYSNTYKIRIMYRWEEGTNDTEAGHDSTISEALSKIKVDVTLNFNQYLANHVIEGAPGDIDGNGEINENDVSILARYVAQLPTDITEEEILIRGDLDVDGEVGAEDLTLLSRYVSGWDISLDQSNAELYNIIKNSKIASSDTINYDASSFYAEGYYNSSSGYAYLPGVYQLKEDSKVYFYRGSVNNNNVIFGGFCWKIVRTTNTKGVKLIYGGLPSGSKCTTGVGSIGTTAYNTGTNNEKYAGYTYENNGVTQSSNIKSYIDNWYRNNLLSYASYLEDTPFCNDTEQYLRDEKVPNRSELDGAYIFKSLPRASAYSTETNPSLSCKNAYKYTVANGKLTYPIALITADEAILAGATSNLSKDPILCLNTTYYLIGMYYWTMTPICSHCTIQSTPNVTAMTTIGDILANRNVLYSSDVSPVISLKPGIKVLSGNGTSETPYVIKAPAA